MGPDLENCFAAGIALRIRPTGRRRVLRPEHADGPAVPPQPEPKLGLLLAALSVPPSPNNAVAPHGSERCVCMRPAPVAWSSIPRLGFACVLLLLVPGPHELITPGTRRLGCKDA